MSLEAQARLITLLGVLLVSGFASVACLFAAVQRLARAHRAAWEALGSPLLVNNSVSAQVALLRFQWSRRYVALNDPVLTRLFVVSAILSSAWALCFLLITGLFIAGVFGRPAA
jgi:hypothetical protein